MLCKICCSGHALEVQKEVNQALQDIATLGKTVRFILQSESMIGMEKEPYTILSQQITISIFYE